MTTFNLEVFKKSNYIDHQEDERNIILKNRGNCTSTAYFNIDGLDYEPNKGKLKASFVNVSGNFNIWIGLAHKNSVNTGRDIKENDYLTYKHIE